SRPAIKTGRDDVVRAGGRRSLSFLFQSGAAFASVFPEVSVSFADRLAVSGVRLDTRVLSVAAPASDRGFQIQSVDGPDAAIHRLRLPRIYEERDHRQALSAPVHSTCLHVGLARAAAFLLGLPQHALVSVRFVVTQIVNLRSLLSIIRLNRNEL